MLPVNLFIGNVYSAANGREVNINPIGVLRFLPEKQGVLNDPRIGWILKGIGETGFVEGLIFVLGKLYSCISPGLGCIGRRAAGNNK